MNAVIPPKANACASCKYWGRSYEPTKTGQRDCSFIDLSDSPTDELVYIDAGAHDDSGLSAVLMTASTFGCVLHTPKLIEVEFTSYGMCIITFPDGSQATMQGEEASEFEDELEEAEEEFEPSEAFPTYEDLEQYMLSQYSEVAQMPEDK